MRIDAKMHCFVLSVMIYDIFRTYMVMYVHIIVMKEYDICLCSYHLYVICILIISYVNIYIMSMYMHLIISYINAHNTHIYILFNSIYIYRAHLENKFLLMKLPGTIEWLKRKRPSVVGEKMYDILLLYIY